MKAVCNYLTWGPVKATNETKKDEMIELVNVKAKEAGSPATNPRVMKAEILSTEKALLQILEQVKSDPEMMNKVLEGLDPNNSLHSITTQLLSEDLTTSQIILSDEQKAEEWFDKISADNIKLLDSQEALKLEEEKKKSTWRYYHLVTVPAKYTFKAGKLAYKGYCFVSSVMLPLSVGALVIQSPWLPVLRLILGRVL